MAWARLSDDLHDHDKVTSLTVDVEGLAAYGLWTLALTWVRADFRRKGVVPAGQVGRFGCGNGKQLASRLVEVGLWDEVPGGYRFHDFDQVYTSEDLSQKRAEAGRRGGIASGKSRARNHLAGNSEANTNQVASSDEAKGPEASHARARATNHSPLELPPPPPNAATPAVDQPEGEGEGEEPNREQVLLDEIRAKRPEWSARSIATALRDDDVAQRPWPVVAAAIHLVADDPKSQGPGRLKADGPWWSEAASTARRDSRPAKPPQCGECDENRMVASQTRPDARVRCPTCHPLRGAA